MTTIQKKPDSQTAHLTPEDIEMLGIELDAIRQSVIDSRGESDAKYIRKVIKTQRSLELGSRAVLLFSMYLLHDVSRIVRGGETNYITATLNLFLDVYNIFISLLQLLLAFTGQRD